MHGMRDKQPPKKLLLFIVLSVIALTGATAVVWNYQADNQSKTKTIATAEASSADSSGSSKVKAATTISYKGEDGKTALELLKKHATVVTKDSSYGPYVDSVGNVQGGTDGKYWMFYVNGQQAAVGANDYVTKSGDTIEWKFE